MFCSRDVISRLFQSPMTSPHGDHRNAMGEHGYWARAWL